MRVSERAVRLAAGIVVLGAATGCEVFSTMSDPASIEPHELEPIPPPVGSIPIDGLPAYNLATVEGLLTNPRTPSEASLANGKQYYDWFCVVCHGKEGLGDGFIAGKFPAIPSLATEITAGRSDEYLFTVISQGRGLMPAYGRIPREARWDVVNHVRTITAPFAQADEVGQTPEEAQ